MAMVSGSKTVAAAGTAERLVSTTTVVRWVAFTAKKVAGANTGTVYLGDSTVDSTSPQYQPLPAGYYWEPNWHGLCVDLYDIWIDAATTGDGVVFNYII